MKPTPNTTWQERFYKLYASTQPSEIESFFAQELQQARTEEAERIYEETNRTVGGNLYEKGYEDGYKKAHMMATAIKLSPPPEL